MKSIGEMVGEAMAEYKSADTNRRQEIEYRALCEVRGLLEHLLSEFQEVRRLSDLDRESGR